MSAKGTFIFVAFLVPVLLWAEENPFLKVREKYQWAIEEIGRYHRTKPEAAPRKGQGVVPFKAQTLSFGTETDKARITVTLTTQEGGFILDVASDEPIQGWILRRHSTRLAIQKGGATGVNSNKLRIRVGRPYLTDFGLTVFVTADGDPAYVRLF